MGYKLIYFIYILCIIIPFSQSVPLVNIAGRTLHIGFDTIIINVILIGFLIAMLVRRKHIIIIDKSLKWLIIWWCWTLLMVVFTAAQSSGAQTADAIIVFFRWSQYIPIFFIVLNVKVSPLQVKNVILVCGITIIFLLIVNIIEYFVIGIDYTVTRGSTLVVRSAFIENAHLNYNISAVYLAMVTLVIAPFLVLSHNWVKLSAIPIIILALAGIWVTSSRSGFLSLILGSVFLGLRYFRRTFIYCTIILLPPATGVLWFLQDTHLVRNFLKFKYLPQALPLLLGGDLQALGLPEIAAGGVQRLLLWREAFLLFIQSPVYGHGFRATRWSRGTDSYFTADNYYLEMLADTGLIGLTLFIIFAYTLFVSAKRLYAVSGKGTILGKFSIGYQASFIAVMFVNLFAGMFMTQMIWGLFILFSALVCNQLRTMHRQAIVANCAKC